MYIIVSGISSVIFRSTSNRDIRYVPPCEIKTIGARRNNLYIHAGNEIFSLDASEGIYYDNGATQATYYSARGVANNWVFADCSGGGAPSGTGVEYLQTFINETTVTVNHNLGDQYPNVEVLDDTGETIEAHVDFDNVNTLTVTLSPAASGTVVCRAVV